MSEVTTVGIDLAKQVFSIHAVDRAGHIVMKRTVRRAQLVELIANIPPCLIGMEACSGAHEWGRRFVVFGHQVRLMAPKFIIPYRKGGKNDGNDAEAICEAVSRPSMRFVPLKSVEQQSALLLHRVRQGFIEERTAMINRIRGLLSEFGRVLPQGSRQLHRQLSAHLDSLPHPVQVALQELREHVRLLEERIDEYERRITDHAKSDARAQRALALRGVGPITASAMVASVGNAREFNNARQFAAWLGLVPRQYTTGGKVRLGHITSRGDPYLRTLLIMGARSTLLTAARRRDRRSRWALAIRQRRGYHRACVAIANKHARILWVLLAKDRALRAEELID